MINFYFRIQTILYLCIIVFCVHNISLNAQEEFGDDYKDAVDLFNVGNALVESYIDGTAKTQDVLSEASLKYHFARLKHPNFKEAYYNWGVCYTYHTSWEGSLNMAIKQFNKAAELDPKLNIDAQYGIAYATYNLNKSGLREGSTEWEKAVSPAINLLNKIISNYPGTSAADNSRKLLKYIDWERTYGWEYTLYNGRKGKPAPFKPVPKLIQINNDATLMNKIKSNIVRAKEGVVSDDSFTFRYTFGGHDDHYMYSGKVYNTVGVPLHKYFLQIFPSGGGFTNTFRSLKFSLEYDNETVKIVNLNLGDANEIAYLASKGKIDKTPQTIIDYAGIRVGIVTESVETDPNGSGLFKSYTARIIIEIKE